MAHNNNNKIITVLNKLLLKFKVPKNNFNLHKKANKELTQIKVTILNLN